MLLNHFFRLTGIIADYGKIKKHNSDQFRFYCGLDVCRMESSLVMHACPDSRETELMYNVWKNADVSQCLIEPVESVFSSKPINKTN